MQKPLAPQAKVKLFWGVRLAPTSPVVSVITHDYYEHLQESSPANYKYLLFSPFFSSRSFTQLNRLAPFRISSRFGLASQLAPVPAHDLTEQESEHWQAHREILSIYSEFSLPPLPPWKVSAPHAHVAEALAMQMRRIERNVIRRF